jgi:hypothetical protein
MINMTVAFVIGLLLGSLGMFAHQNGIYNKLGGK